MAHATDGGGSIRIPAANCGLFGLKPTRGRNPSGPDVGEGWSGMSTGHVVSRSVRDSARMLDCTHGPAPGDPYAAPPPARPFINEVGADTGQLRIALMTNGFDGRLRARQAKCSQFFTLKKTIPKERVREFCWILLCFFGHSDHR